ncbi:MAG: hypothetical protein M1819_001071 [Sarea resinae]|nr:MAG: hypothetical protein M1819_001071 [Sarea resinae]
MAQIRSMEARTGRKNQRYGITGERLVAGVVPLSPDKTKVLCIQSTRRGGWVLPKGGWETDELAHEAACREAWEEAGVVCQVERALGLPIPERRPPHQVTPEAPKASYQFFEVSVLQEHQDWPERSKRGRRWMGYFEARSALAGRPELLEALERSNIVKR